MIRGRRRSGLKRRWRRSRGVSMTMVVDFLSFFPHHEQRFRDASLLLLWWL